MTTRRGPQQIERRAFATALRIERRAEGETRTIAGHAAVFNQLSEELWGFREVVAPGAFRKTLGADVRALWNHDPNHVLGRSKSGTLRLREDEVGLAIEIDPPDTAMARDLVTLIERGDVSQMSFGFRTVTDSWRMLDGEPVRTLEEVELFDVSPVTFPAYPETDVAVRSLEAWRAGGERRDMVDPMADGTCPEGYELGEDGMCHLMDEAARDRASGDLDRRRRRLRLTTLDSRR